MNLQSEDECLDDAEQLEDEELEEWEGLKALEARTSSRLPVHGLYITTKLVQNFGGAQKPVGKFQQGHL